MQIVARLGKFWDIFIFAFVSWSPKDSMHVLQGQSVRLWAWASMLGMGAPKLLQKKPAKRPVRNELQTFAEKVPTENQEGSSWGASA